MIKTLSGRSIKKTYTYTRAIFVLEADTLFVDEKDPAERLRSDFLSLNMVSAPPASVLSFYTSEIAFCIPCPLVKEVLPIPQLTVPPGCPEILEGLLLSDKTSRPVMDLARLFDRMASPVEKFTPLLVLDTSVTSLVLKVDRVCSIIDCRALELVGVEAADSFNGACCGIYELNGERLHLLDLDRLLTQREARLLEDFTRQSHSRLSAFGESA